MDLVSKAQDSTVSSRTVLVLCHDLYVLFLTLGLVPQSCCKVATSLGEIFLKFWSRETLANARSSHNGTGGISIYGDRFPGW